MLILNILLSSLIVLKISHAAPWKKNSYNDPNYYKITSFKYDDFPKEAQTPHIPIPSAHWLHYKGGIAWRYQSNDSNYSILKNLDEVRKKKDLNQLSPAEKYDIARSDYNFSLTRQERLNQETFQYKWEGHCHGWAVTSYFENIPKKQVSLKNKEGIEITFEPQDVIALLSYFYGMYQSRWNYTVPMYKIPHVLKSEKYPEGTIQKLINSLDSAQEKEKISKIIQQKKAKLEIVKDLENFAQSLTNRYFYSPYFGEKNEKETMQPQDLNPGALHLILTNLFGNPEIKNRYSLIADTDALSPVWNRPLFGYKFKELQRQKNAVQVEMSVQFIKELEIPYTGMIDIKKHIHSKLMKYTLELDNQGHIIGGEWDPKSDRLDFIWTAAYADFSKIYEIKYYNPRIFNELLKNQK